MAPAMRRLAARPNGHEVIAVNFSASDGHGRQAGAPALFICVLCGHYTAEKVKTLGKACERHCTDASRKVLRKVLR